MNGDGLLKMSELAQASGVSAGTIKHYLREGLLGAGDDGVLRTSRNMAYYPPEFGADPAHQAPAGGAFMPLRLIRQVLDEDPERAQAIVDTEDRIIERALERRAGDGRLSVEEVRERYAVPQDALDRLAELEILTPDEDGYERDDVAMVEALSRFRAGGYDESLGFTVYETLRYREALQPLVEEEVRSLLDRLLARSKRTRRWRSSSRHRAAAGADRRDALQAADRGAAAAAGRYQRAR